MFPMLLDDQSLFIEFEKFIEAIDGLHELALDGHQKFPVFCWKSFWHTSLMTMHTTFCLLTHKYSTFFRVFMHCSFSIDECG